MSASVNGAKNPLVVGLLALIAGLILGLVWGWVIQPVKFSDATPAILRSDLQDDYLRMAIDSFRVNRDPNLAVQRWNNLGAAAAPSYARIQQDPGGLDPAVIAAFGQVIQTVSGENPASPTEVPTQGGLISGTTVLLLALAVILLVGVAIAFVFLRRLLTNRTSDEVTPTMQANEINREASKNRTNFESMGVAPPVTQNMTTYVLGDDLYDESFSIDTASGDFLGEYGVGIAETMGIGDPKKVTALEIWLFDKNDIKTATKVLMSGHAFGDMNVRSRLEAKGELIQLEPQKQVMLETETLQLLATIVDLQYGDGPMPDKSFFERVTLELAIWGKANHQEK